MGTTQILSRNTDIEQEELRGFSRSIAELEWLMLILGLLYLFVPGTSVDNQPAVIAAMVAFAGFVVTFRYTNFHRRENRWKIAIETWAMIGFISWLIWHTGKIDSPLLNLYLLVIIACALTLGKLVTLMEVLLISAAYIYMGHAQHGSDIFSLQTFADLMSTFSPFLLVAYLATMLSSDMHHARRRIVSVAETDELTGLPNMRAFTALLDKECKRFARHGQPFSLLMIDTDGLKEVNDRFGHEAGNRLIVTVANTIGERLRTSDVLARYGGDEFVLLLPTTECGQAQGIAERIRTAIENASFDAHGQRISTTVSIGAANCPDDAISSEELLRKADSALYGSKRGGRNRITRWQTGLSTPVPSAAG